MPCVVLGGGGRGEDSMRDGQKGEGSQEDVKKQARAGRKGVLLARSKPIRKARFKQVENQWRRQTQAGLPLPQLLIPSPWAQGLDINCDSADLKCTPMAH